MRHGFAPLRLVLPGSPYAALTPSARPLARLSRPLCLPVRSFCDSVAVRFLSLIRGLTVFSRRGLNLTSLALQLLLF